MKEPRITHLFACFVFMAAAVSTGADARENAGAALRSPGSAVCSNADNHPVCLAPGDAAPRFRLRDLGNRWRRLDEFVRSAGQSVDATAGKPVLIDFFAMNCTVCREMMPMLVDFAGRNAGRVQVMVIAVTDPADRGDRKLREYFKRVGARFPVLTDSRGAEAARWVEMCNREAVLPQMFLLDDSGIVRGVAGGRHQSIESALPELRSFVAP